MFCHPLNLYIHRKERQHSTGQGSSDAHWAYFKLLDLGSPLYGKLLWKYYVGQRRSWGRNLSTARKQVASGLSRLTSSTPGNFWDVPAIASSHYITQNNGSYDKQLPHTWISNFPSLPLFFFHITTQQHHRPLLPRSIVIAPPGKERALLHTAQGFATSSESLFIIAHE